ncbi:MAG: 5'-methylthioadenosine/S-adenosylhomocysteine nucleosidase, partial [Atopobium sp.]|nr:5'-methylthioadenosine/S-adenosylhomocysteine nucleosidase [Atopobium sp.]
MKIGIIGAMEPEVALLKEQMTIEHTYEQARMQFVEGLLGEVPVVVVQSGIGKVNAAACTQILIDTFAVTHVINTGIAGLLNSELQVGDIVISSDLVQHDMNVGPLNFAAGQIPGLPVFSFTADEGLVEHALASAK